MKRLEVLSVSIKSEPAEVVKHDEYLANNSRWPTVTYFAFKVPVKDTNLFKGDTDLYVFYKGKSVPQKARMNGYHVGDGWVQFGYFWLIGEATPEEIIKDLEVYKYK